MSMKVDKEPLKTDKVPIYFILVKNSLKGDVVAGIFIFGWFFTLLAVEILSFQFGSLTAKFYEILPTRSSAQLTTISLQFGTFLVMMALGKGTLLATRGLLARAMRRNLTNHLQGKYVCLRGLKSQIQSDQVQVVDCPDQRITEDIEKFSMGLLQIGEVIFISPILILFYTVQVSQRLGVLSLITIYTHFTLSVAVLSLGLGRLKRLTAEKEKREASFRSEHVSLRENRESFFLINSDSVLKRLHGNLSFQLQKLLFTSKQLLLTEAVMELGKNFFTYSGALLNFFLLASELTWGRWRDEEDSAKIANLISMTSFLSLYLIFQLSKLAGVLDSIGILNGQVARLKQFIDVLEVDDNEIVDESAQFEVEFRNFSARISTNNSLLYKDLNLSIKPGQNILITGENGTGKTSVLRFVSGLWSSDSFGGSLRVSRPIGRERPFFMTCPQNWAVFTGSLYDILGIEVSSDIVDDEEAKIDQNHQQNVEEALDVVGLASGVLMPFDLKRPLTIWQTILTPGQHQRIALARALLHHPHLLALDETCLAMGTKETEAILTEMNKRDITIIFIDPTPEGTFTSDLFSTRTQLTKLQ